MFKLFFCLYLLSFVPSLASASEGFYFLENSRVAAQKSIVKISTKLKIQFNVTEPKLPYVDDDGFAVWGMSYKQAPVNSENCKLEYFRFYPYLKEACKALEQGHSLEDPIVVEHAATGEIISSDGFILTAAHLVSNCAFLANKKSPYRCPLLEVTDNQGIKHPEVDVYFIGQGKGQDFAILKINRNSADYIQLNNSVVESGPYTAIGFPMISKRPLVSLQKNNYIDADGTLRFSVGELIPWSNLSAKAHAKAIAVGFQQSAYILTDIDLVPGNSGGALFNKEGALIGITNGILDGKGPLQENPITQFLVSSENPTVVLTTKSICKSIDLTPLLGHLKLCQ